MLSALLGAVSLWSANASAQSAVLASPPDSAELREVRVAVATGPKQSTVWFNARLEGAADNVFVVVPARPGATLDTASDAFFEALVDVTQTRVLPPGDAPDVTCSAARLPQANEHELVGDSSHVETVQPLAQSQVLSFTQLVVWAQGEGLNLTFDAMSMFADLDLAGYRFVVLQYEVAPGQATLATLRVASSEATTKVPLLLSGAGAAPTTLRVWTFAHGRANPVSPWATVDSQDVSWSIAGTVPPTNYGDVLTSVFESMENASWVVDAASHAPIFRSTPLFQGSLSIPSVVEAYFERAAAYGDAGADPSACIARVASLESSQGQVADVCAPGSLAVVDALPCQESPQPGQILPDDLRCGGTADDLALAMAGATPKDLWLTRWTGQLPPWTAWPQEDLAVEAGASKSSVVVCGGWDTSICEADAGPGGGGGSGGSGGSGGGGGTGGGGIPSGSGAYGYGGGATEYIPDNDPYYDDYNDTEVHVEASCWGDTSSSADNSDDSCSGDSSSSQGQDSCSGDSSSASDDTGSCSGDSSNASEGDSCAGDSSDSSGGDSCSGDSSDSSSSGADTCSGDSSGGSSGGDSCSGSSGSSGSSSDCSMSNRRSGGGRLPTSAFALLIVACTLAARRLRKVDEGRAPFR